MKKLFCLSLLVCALFSTALCQPAHQESVIKAARKDAKTFKLDDAVWKKYKRTLPASSDYFKPTDSVPEKRALMADSVYVAAYRKAAYQQNRHRRTPWHYMWIGGTITAGLAIAGGIAIALIVGPTMN